MSQLTASKPFRDMEALLDRFGRNLGIGPKFLQGEGKEPMALADWRPSVDIVESAREYLIKAELPEVRKEDVELSMQDHILTIKGQRRTESEETERKFHRVERSYGSFSRSFTLPDDVDPTEIRASYEDGMLYVHLAKAENQERRSETIEIE